MTPASKLEDDNGPVGPAIERGYEQTRDISPVAGAPKGWRRIDGLRYLRQRKLIGGHQEDAGNRLLEDYEISQLRAMPRSGSTRGGHGPRDIPQSAIDASSRYEAALAVIPSTILTMTTLFLIPKGDEDEAREFYSMERIAQLVGEDKRAVPLGIRTALELLARHYGMCS